MKRTIDIVYNPFSIHVLKSRLKMIITKSPHELLSNLIEDLKDSIKDHKPKDILSEKQKQWETIEYHLEKCQDILEELN